MIIIAHPKDKKMNKEQQLNMQKAALEAEFGIVGKQIPHLKPKSEFVISERLRQECLMILTMAVDTNDDNEEDKEKKKKQTKKEFAKIVAETKAEKKAMLTTAPPPPYTNLIAAMGLSKKNPLALCSYIIDKCPRIIGVSEYITCNPPVSASVDLYDLLQPLAIKNRKDVTSDERTSLELYTTQIRERFTSTVDSCITLSNGNALLFALLHIETRKKGSKYTGDIAAVVFRLTAKSGSGKIKVWGKAVKGAVNYTVYYGPGAAYDPATWKQKTGSLTQVISGLKPGDLISFIMVGNGGNKNVSDWADPQSINVPYN